MLNLTQIHRQLIPTHERVQKISIAQQMKTQNKDFIPILCIEEVVVLL